MSGFRISVSHARNMLQAVVIIAIAFGIAGLSESHAQENESALWEALRSGGHVALLRHAIAPGNGDPAEFTIGDCSTQRNLSDSGRAQAGRIGQRFRANGIQTARIFSSQWCRCRDTAVLLQLGPVTGLAELNSFYQRSARREPQTRALRGWLMRQDLTDVHVLVTHQVNITALTGVFPSSGELVIVRPSESGDVVVFGTIETQ